MHYALVFALFASFLIAARLAFGSTTVRDALGIGIFCLVLLTLIIIVEGYPAKSIILRDFVWMLASAFIGASAGCAFGCGLTKVRAMRSV